MQAALLCGFTVGKAPSGLDIFAPLAQHSSEDAAPGGNVQEEVLVAVCQGRACQIWRTSRSAQTLVATLSVPKKHLALNCKISPSGNSVAVVSSQRTVSIWDWALETKRQTLRGHLDEITGCVYWGQEHNREFLASFGTDGKVLLWETESDDGALIATLQHSCAVRDVDFMACQGASSTLAFVGLVNGSVHVWTMRTGSGTLIEPVRVYTFTAPGGCLCSVSSAPSGHRICVGAAAGAVSLWNALPLKLADSLAACSDGLAGAEEAHEAGDGDSSEGEEDDYVAMPDNCFGVADGGAATLDECQREFEAVLLEYQFEGHDDLPSAIPSTAGSRQPRKSRTGKNRSDAHGRRAPDLESTLRITLRSGCVAAGFALGSLQESHCPAVVFTSSKDGCVSAWCAETGKRLFDVKLAAPLQAMRVEAAAASPAGLSRYHVFGMCAHEVVGFEVRGLDELQALAEFVGSADVATCESFWAHAPRRAALRRALRILGLEGTTQERSALAELMSQRTAIGEAMQQKAGTQRLLHAASAEDFFRTLVGRIEKRTGRELYSRVTSATQTVGLDIETLCKFLVTCPFAVEDVLDAIAMPAASFLRATSLDKDRFLRAVQGASGDPAGPFLEALGCEAIPAANRNSWGGDASVGMFLEPRPFFYACAIVDATSGAASSGADSVAAGMPLLAPLYTMSAAQEKRIKRERQEQLDLDERQARDAREASYVPPLQTQRINLPIAGLRAVETMEPIADKGVIPLPRSLHEHGHGGDSVESHASRLERKCALEDEPLKSVDSYVQELTSPTRRHHGDNAGRSKSDWFRPGELAPLRLPGCLVLSPKTPPASAESRTRGASPLASRIVVKSISGGPEA